MGANVCGTQHIEFKIGGVYIFVRIGLEPLSQLKKSKRSSYVINKTSFRLCAS